MMLSLMSYHMSAIITGGSPAADTPVAQGISQFLQSCLLGIENPSQVLTPDHATNSPQASVSIGYLQNSHRGPKRAVKRRMK